MDEELRPAIDRLISAGGRLTVTGASAAGRAVIVLDQPGSRFGILEVRGRAELTAPDDAVTAGLLAAGWSDPNVTQRLGREFRIGSADGLDRPVTLARTWRVPPVLASEIALEVRTAAGTIEQVELEPLGAGRASAAPTATSADPRMPPPAELEETVGDRPDDIADPSARRLAARTVPAPFRAIAAVVLVVVIGVTWVGMIRGAPRVVGGGTPSPIGASPAPTPALATASPVLTPEPPPASTSPLGTHLVSASTETSSGPATDAIDGDPATAWHAAFGVPQWIEIALDTPSTVHDVVMLIAQDRSGATRHMIQVAQANGVYEVVGIVDRRTSDGDQILFRPTTPLQNVDRIRIETMASPSDAGWYEVIVH